jgi:glutamate-1-semialdehyde 2,1-aminomutase
MAVGIAVLSYLNAHPDTYTRLNAMGETLRSALDAMVRRHEFPVTVVGAGSLFITRFVTGPVRSVRDLVGENRRAYAELFPRLARRGVFVPNTHFGLLSAAHTDDDLQRIVDAHEAALCEMREIGLL